MSISSSASLLAPSRVMNLCINGKLLHSFPLNVERVRLTSYRMKGGVFIRVDKKSMKRRIRVGTC